MGNIAAFLIVLSISWTSNAQSSFYKVFGGSLFDYGFDVTEDGDLGYLIGGTSGSFQFGNAQAFLLKINQNGDFLWSQSYGGPESDGALELKTIPNWGSYLLGYSNELGGSYNTRIWFVDAQGNEQWSTIYDGPNWERGVEAALASDSGLIVGIHNLGANTQEQDISILRLSNQGDTLWAFENASPGFDEITCIEPFNDSLFVVSANHFDTSTNNAYAYLRIFHENGGLVWSDTIGQALGGWTINDFFLSNDTLVGIGSAEEFNGQTSDNYHYLFRISEGNYGDVGSYVFQGSALFHGSSITNFLGSDLRYAAYEYNDFQLTPAGGNDAFISLYAYNLGFLSPIDFTNTEGGDAFVEAIPTTDSGAVFVGYTAEMSGGASVAVVKIGKGFDYPDIEGADTLYQLVGIEGNKMREGISLFPNPTHGELFIECVPGIVSNYEVLSMQGSILREGEINKKKTRIELQNLCQGYYLVRVYDDGNHSLTKKFVKQ